MSDVHQVSAYLPVKVSAKAGILLLLGFSQDPPFSSWLNYRSNVVLAGGKMVVHFWQN
jgi:hypothetical protein